MLLEKKINAQLMRIFLPLYGLRGFIAMLTRGCQWKPFLSHWS
jgi:hypothetical protein